MIATEHFARIQARFANSPIDPREVQLLVRIILQEIVDGLYEARLARGTPLTNTDLIGTKEYFEELLAAVNQSILPACDATHLITEGRRLRLTGRVPQRPFDMSFCPDCGHIHIDQDECSFPIGGGRKCLCERRMPA